LTFDCFILARSTSSDESTGVSGPALSIVDIELMDSRFSRDPSVVAGSPSLIPRLPPSVIGDAWWAWAFVDGDGDHGDEDDDEDGNPSTLDVEC